MNFVVILSFVAMVLAPCGVALWGRLREGADEDEVRAATMSMAPAADGPIARYVKTVRGALSPGRRDGGAGTGPRTPEPESEPAPVLLEDLLREAIESAHAARAASLRADAAASGAAARIAAVRAEAAAEQARRTHLDAAAAEQAAHSAQAAYEAARAEADRAGESEPRQAIRLVSDRRAA